MKDRYQGELPECLNFDFRAGIHLPFGCGKGVGMEMAQAGPIANGNFPTEDAT